MVAIAQTKIVLVGKFELVTNQLQQNQTQNQDATCRIERIAKSMTSQYPFLFCNRRSSLWRHWKWQAELHRRQEMQSDALQSISFHFISFDDCSGYFRLLIDRADVNASSHWFTEVRIAGHSTEFVNRVLERVKGGEPSGGLDEIW